MTAISGGKEPSETNASPAPPADTSDSLGDDNSVASSGVLRNASSSPSSNASSNASSEASFPFLYNLGVLAAFQVLLRLGWIFKTESIVMPAVVDALGGSATTRGWLPMLSRFALAVPPIFAADAIRRMSLKKRALMGFTVLMGGAFLVLAQGINVTPNATQRLSLFFMSYTLFFVFAGLSQVSFGTLQGRLIPVAARGRLMLASNVIGASVAVTAAALLLPRWLTMDGGDFTSIFTFSGSAIIVAGLVSLWADEPPQAPEVAAGRSPGLREVWQVFCEHPPLRRTALVSALGSCSILLFPHYQALGRTRLDLDYRSLLAWVVVQNVGTAAFSILAGLAADRRGNRIVMIILLGSLAAIPGCALAICHWGVSGSFPLVFFMIGLMPVFMRIVQNYTLEIGAPEDHPHYLAVIKLCNALPFLASAGVGAGVDALGFEWMFAATVILVGGGCALALRLEEPRAV